MTCNPQLCTHTPIPTIRPTMCDTALLTVSGDTQPESTTISATTTASCAASLKNICAQCCQLLAKDLPITSSKTQNYPKHLVNIYIQSYNDLPPVMYNQWKLITIVFIFQITLF